MNQFDEQGYFTRKSTGLVRQISAFDSFVYNQSYINVGMILLYAFLYGAALYPGGSLWVAVGGGALLAIPTALVHGMLAATFPRSGGEYVYNSRILTPALGFASNWNITLWLFFYMGVACNWFSVYGLAPLSRFLGVSTGNGRLLQAADWMSGKQGAFVAGTAILAVVTALHCVKPLLAVRIQRWWFLLGVVGLLIIAGGLLISNQTAYKTAFDSYYQKLTGTPAGSDAIQTKAAGLGFAPAAITFMATFVMLYWPANFYFWGNASTYLGGEVKHARKTQLFSLPVAALFSALLALLTVVAFERTVGKGLIGAIGYNMLLDPQHSIPLIYSELGAVACGTVLGTIALAGCTYWGVAFVFSVLSAMTRNLLAWSLDRIVPTALSDVHDRYHTPTKAIIVGAILCEIGLYLFTFVPVFAVMVGIFGAYLTFMTTSLAAAVFPFRRKQLFALSPVNWRLGSVPVITIVGVLSLLGLGLLDWSVFSDPWSGISLSPKTDAGAGAGIPFRMFWISIGVYGLGILVYYAAAFVRRVQGVNISLAFQEIPPE